MLYELSLFTGYAGMTLGLRLAGLEVRNVGYCEIDPYCQEIIKARIRDGLLDDAPIYPDIRAFNGLEWRGAVDIITAGFPCTPHSLAGRRGGVEDPRDLWPATAQVISDVRPQHVLLENAGIHLRSRGQPAYAYSVIADLAALGYVGVWGVVGARDVGAPHRRDRWWCLGYLDNTDAARWREARERPEQHTAPEPETRSGNVDNSDSSSRETRQGLSGLAYKAAYRTGLPLWPPGPGDVEGWRRVLAGHPELAPAIDGRLACTFVEQLMGLPLGWTDVYPLTTQSFYGTIWETLLGGVNGYPDKGRPGEILSSVRDANGEATVQRTHGGHGSVSQKGVLSAQLHGEGNDQRDAQPSISEKKGSGVSGRCLPELRGDGGPPYSPSGQQPREQCREQLADALRLLSSEITLGDIPPPPKAQASALRHLWKVMCETQQGDVRETLAAVQETWESLSDDEVRWVHLQAHRRIAATRFRVQRLKALGNGVVPLALAAFLKIIKPQGSERDEKLNPSKTVSIVLPGRWQG